MHDKAEPYGLGRHRGGPACPTGVLIMTIMPRTARAHTPEPFWLINESQLPLPPDQARQHTSLMRIAGTSLAMGVIRNLLRCSEASSRAKLASIPPNVCPCAFTPTQIEGLRAALYFLRRYGDGLLEAERGE